MDAHPTFEEWAAAITLLSLADTDSLADAIEHPADPDNVPDWLMTEARRELAERTA